MPRKQRPEGTRAPNGASSIYLGKDGKWHGRVTMGTRDDGKPDRRHVERKTEAEVIKEVRKLERERDTGTARKAGPVWTVEKWLTHWVENISAPTVRDTTASGYRVAVYHHLIPGLGAHRLDKVAPEHFEKFYKKMSAVGSKPATVHQVHRTARTALNVAVARGYINRNPVVLAKPPRLEEDEIEPYTMDEVQVLIATSLTQRNGVRFVIALATGLRQGEVLGLKWADVDLAAGTIRVRESRLRPKYGHGCQTPCKRKYPGYCPNRVQINATTGPVKSRAGRRPFPLPGRLTELLAAHQEVQNQERTAAGNLWAEGGWVFATETGEAINPRTDWDAWKELLKSAGVRDARLHDARHTAATNLLVAGVLDRVAQGLMGWSDATMARRYQHLTAPVQADAAKRIGDLLWKPKGVSGEDSDQAEKG